MEHAGNKLLFKKKAICSIQRLNCVFTSI